MVTISLIIVTITTNITVSFFLSLQYAVSYKQLAKTVYQSFVKSNVISL